jgi:hypothetical protein
LALGTGHAIPVLLSSVIARSVSDVAISDKCKSKTSKGKMTSQKLKAGIRFQLRSLLEEQKHFCIFICHFDF